MIRVRRAESLIVSFASPARVLSWAVLNGGFCHADQSSIAMCAADDAAFCAQPGPWLGARLWIRTSRKIVAMATAVEMSTWSQVSMSGGGAEVNMLRDGGLRQRTFRGRPGLGDA